MTRRSGLLAAAQSALLLGAVVPVVARPAHAMEALERARAERLAVSGRCDEALPMLEHASAEDPADAHLAALAGQCALRLERYDAAITALERAKRADPKLPDVDLSLAIARFHAEDPEGALRAIGDARAAGSRRPELDFYEGMALLALGRQPDLAASSLERATESGAGDLDPVATYYAGLAWQRAQLDDRARKALQKVIDEHPDSPWAEAARRALAGPAEAPLGRWVRVQAGMEWDSNVVFRGNGVVLPQDIGHQADVGGVWAAEIAAELWRHGPWTVGAHADYTGSAYTDLHEFDLQYPGGGVWLDRRLSESSLLRFDYAAHYGWLGYDPYVLANTGTAQWLHGFGRYGTLRTYGEVLWYDFFQNSGDVPGGPGVVGAPCVGSLLCGPPALNEARARNRDGVGGVVGVEHTLPIRAIRGEVWGGPFGEVYGSRGTEYDYDGFGLRAGVRSELPFGLVLRSFASYEHRPFAHPSTYPSPRDPNLATAREYGLSGHDRSDEVFEVGLELERAITSQLSVTLRYDYLRNASNVDVYDYDRNLVGGYLTWAFSR